MAIIKKLADILFSTKMMGILIILFALSMAVATFVENDFGTLAAKAAIYQAKWFEGIMFLLVVNFLGQIVAYKLYRKEKWSGLLMHLAFVVILLGSFITRYYSFEGVISIREGAKSSTIYSEKSFVDVTVDNGEFERKYREEVLYTKLSRNKYSLKDDFSINDGEKTPFKIEMIEFVPNVRKSFEKLATGKNHIEIEFSDQGGNSKLFIEEGEVKNVNNLEYTFNDPKDGAMNFYLENDKLTFQPFMDCQFKDRDQGNLLTLSKDSIQEIQLNQMYFFNEFGIRIQRVEKGRMVKSSMPKSQHQNYPYDALTFKIESGDEERILEVMGIKSTVSQPETISLNGLNYSISYGSKLIKLPFELFLRDFELEKYPGTNSASSYASEVTVLDTDNEFDYRIYMNHVLDHKGYRFFQSSYDMDEKGTVLSVNHDYWGTLLSYIGYFLMGLGMMLSLFWKGTRFQKLSSELRKISRSKTAIILPFFLLIGSVAWSQESMSTIMRKNTVDASHADKFGELLIQDHQGRIKPLNTYALEALRKVYKKDSFKGASAEQVLLSSLLKPSFWSGQDLVKVKPNALGSSYVTRLNIKGDHIPLMNFFQNRQYLLQKDVSSAFRKKKALRNATENELINLDERVNILLNVLQGNLLNIYPKRGDVNNKWFTGTDQKAFAATDSVILGMHDLYLTSLSQAMEDNDYSKADKYLNLISEYQKKVNPDIIPASERISLEIKYNKWDIFKKLMFYYMLIGFLFLILAFASLFYGGNKWIKYGLGFFSALTIVGLLFHLFGLGLRWYISGHEPWSNGYEVVIFVAAIVIVAGLIFSFKRSKFTLASGVLFSSFLLGIAHGSMMNPEITNLVPVLKSYWLMIHVAVITSSYGFLGLAALLGFVVLSMYIIRTKNNHDKFDVTIRELTIISEQALTVGIYTLAIGTFLGGVWANESWGRYWSWDPKETWSLISIFIYTFVLHMRLIPGLKGKFAYNVSTMFSISTLIMTFFGVNYYLSGMHSYATGDPVPIPEWVYMAIGFFVIFSIVSFWRYKKYKFELSKENA